MFNPMPFAQQVSLRGTQVLVRYFRYWRDVPTFFIQFYSEVFDRRGNMWCRSYHAMYSLLMLCAQRLCVLRSHSPRRSKV